MPPPRANLLAGAAGGLAAFIWASYYILLVLLPRVPTPTVIVVPFLVAGSAFLVGHPGRLRRGAATLLRRLPTPAGIALGLIFLILQIDVVLATRLTGAVDAALVTLLADVVATPLLVFALLRQDADRFRSVAFWGGVAVAALGAVGTIFAGGSGRPLTLAGAASLIPLPFLVAVFFVWVNEESRSTPAGEVLGAAALLAGFVGLAGGVLLFGPGWTSAPLAPAQWAALLAMGLSSFYLAPWAYFWAAQRTSILVPAVLQALIPVFTLVLVAALIAPVPWIAWVGVPLAFGGSAVAVLAPERAQHAHPSG
ncbi:MAG: DMT family transporter [Euryarchaeota archaeon]|nr:DMT family transporter [Euryarchaeota archaeon]MDE1836057.1 DMT family transporter [Euryarchaeota archaeon]MDE1879995.1 DMT family transporter [Euryarchaeota archaeon]MDE2044035.1 DMT family transporter [Thermoplasmata archaeon]